MKNQVCLLTILVVNFLHCAHGFGRFRLARRQIGLGSFIFPEGKLCSHIEVVFFYIRNNNILCVESFNQSVLTDISPNKVGGLVIVQ